MEPTGLLALERPPKESNPGEKKASMKYTENEHNPGPRGRQIIILRGVCICLLQLFPFSLVSYVPVKGPQLSLAIIPSQTITGFLAYTRIVCVYDGTRKFVLFGICLLTKRP